jgi:hypothetical protein
MAAYRGTRVAWPGLWPLDRLRVVVERGRKVCAKTTVLTAFNYLSTLPAMDRFTTPRLTGHASRRKDGSIALTAKSLPAGFVRDSLAIHNKATTLVARFTVAQATDSPDVVLHETGGDGATVRIHQDSSNSQISMKFGTVESPKYPYSNLASGENEIRLDMDGRFATFGINSQFFPPVPIQPEDAGEILFRVADAKVVLTALYQTLKRSEPEPGNSGS